MVVLEVASDADFNNHLDRAGTKLVVADFYATWCGPCRNIAPVFDQLSTQFPQAVFIRIDVDKCRGTMESQGVSAMPTFIFYVSKNKVDTLRGADPNQLTQKVRQWAESVGGGNDEPSPVSGQVNLATFMEKQKLEFLNCSDDTNPEAFISNVAEAKLTSDCDEQLIINIPFNQPVKIHSLLVTGPPDQGPKTMKLFINLPHTLDFDKAMITEPVQQFEFTGEQLAKGEVINTRYVKFQNVQNIQIFIVDNIGGGEVTVVDSLRLFGTPISNVNMNEFKRVAGKKGEVGH